MGLKTHRCSNREARKNKTTNFQRWPPHHIPFRQTFQIPAPPLHTTTNVVPHCTLHDLPTLAQSSGNLSSHSMAEGAPPKICYACAPSRHTITRTILGRPLLPDQVATETNRGKAGSSPMDGVTSCLADPRPQRTSRAHCHCHCAIPQTRASKVSARLLNLAAGPSPGSVHRPSPGSVHRVTKYPKVPKYSHLPRKALYASDRESGCHKDSP